jgi:hypothetical protein
MVKILLDNKADVNPEGCVSVLATAVAKLRTDTVEMLLEAGADVNAMSTSWYSRRDRNPLMKIDRPLQPKSIAVMNILPY